MDSIQADQNYLRKSTIYTLFGSILKVVPPVLTIVVARFFGKEIFGIYVSTQLLIFTLCRVSVFGLDRGLHRYLPQNKLHNRPDHEGIIESLWFVIGVAFLISMVMWVGSYFGLQRITTGLAMLSSAEISLYALSIVPYTMLLVFSGASEGNRHPQYRIFITDFAVYTLAPVIALVVCSFGFSNKLSLPLGLFSASFLGMLAYIFLINKQFPKIRWFIKRKIPSELLRFSLPLGFSEDVAAFLLRVDLWMVLALLGPEAAGIYAVMVTISNGLKTIRQSYNPILTPVVAGMTKDRLDTDLKPVYTYCVSMVTLIQLVIGFFVVFFPEQTMLIAGRSFITKENPVAVLGILIIGNLINGLFGLSESVINGMGKSKFMLLMNSVSLVFAILMNWLCIPRLGIAGAAVSTMSYQILQCIWMNIYLKRMGYWPYKKTLFIQGLWIVSLVSAYIAFNTALSLELWLKTVCYILTVLLIMLTFWKQGLAGEMFKRKKKKN